MICFITLGPAKQKSEFGSAITISARVAKLALTPPEVGFVITEIYRLLFSLTLLILDAVFYICRV